MFTPYLRLTKSKFGLIIVEGGNENVKGTVMWRRPKRPAIKLDFIFCYCRVYSSQNQTCLICSCFTEALLIKWNVWFWEYTWKVSNALFSETLHFITFNQCRFSVLEFNINDFNQQLFIIVTRVDSTHSWVFLSWLGQTTNSTNTVTLTIYISRNDILQYRNSISEVLIV